MTQVEWWAQSGWRRGCQCVKGYCVEVDLLHPRSCVVGWGTSLCAFWQAVLYLFVDFQWSVKISWRMGLLKEQDSAVVGALLPDPVHTSGHTLAADVIECLRHGCLSCGLQGPSHNLNWSTKTIRQGSVELASKERSLSGSGCKRSFLKVLRFQWRCLKTYLEWPFWSVSTYRVYRLYVESNGGPCVWDSRRVCSVGVAMIFYRWGLWSNRGDT